MRSIGMYKNRNKKKDKDMSNPTEPTSAPVTGKIEEHRKELEIKYSKETGE
jgi:hypothetical protein|tara:strand:+ start:1992 stop:2144 length:153 start_codon:yes stop_codon:yes gene_type:complete